MQIPFINKEGYIVIKLLLIAVISSYILGYITMYFYFLSILFLSLLVLSICFFRDPKRKIYQDENVILSPADGKIVNISKENSLYKIAIFMSIFNVHIQRAPVSGVIDSIEYKRGKFVSANNPIASNNEQNIIIIRNNSISAPVCVKQIAGIFARRIVCWVNAKEKISQGQKIGLIKFGSRVELYFPDQFKLKISLGEKVYAGITVIGTL